MAREAERMNRLVGDLLSLSQVEAEERVRLQNVPTEGIQISFNAGLVIDGLKHMASENVVIALERSDAAAIFLPGEDPSAGVDESDDLCLLMPLRLNE